MNWKLDAANQAMATATGSSPDIRSKKVYKDFDFRFDYRCDANQGVFYRSRVTHDRAWQTGVEFAVNNYTNINKDAPGAAYDLYAPVANAYYLFSTGKWNKARIVVKGADVEHWLNGVKVVSYKYHSAAFWTAYASSKWNASQTLTYNVPGDKTKGFIPEGYLGFQGDHGGKWLIRNIRITSTNVKLGPPLAKESAYAEAEMEGMDEEMALEAPSGAARSGLALRPEAKAPWMIRVPAGGNRRATVDGRVSASALR